MRSDPSTPFEFGVEDDLESLEAGQRISLCETLDRVLNKGVVVVGEVVISVADIDLIYLGLQVVLTSIEAARENLGRNNQGSGLTWKIGKEQANG